MTVAAHKYGRGKFDAHPNYIAYMQEIVEHPNYRGMPNAVSADGRINWQVSSGKGTSFFKDYKARWSWWDKKAKELKIPSGNDRFTIAARRIHPTGYRACRLCGKRAQVGYFYANHTLALRIQKAFRGLKVQKHCPITDALKVLMKHDKIAAKKFITDCFPEWRSYFQRLGLTAQAFEESRHIRTSLLSPGFMGNPPDRLDGFHAASVPSAEFILMRIRGKLSTARGGSERGSARFSS